MRSILMYLCMLSLAAVQSAPGRQQTAQPSGHPVVSGTVSDEQGLALAGANVILTVAGRDLALETTTDGSGKYVFDNVPDGRHQLLVTLNGFAPHRQSVETPSASVIDIRLAIARFHQEVTVTAGIPDFSPVQSIDSTELTYRASEDVGGYLRAESGLFAVRRGSINLEPTVRGLQENQIAMFVDGTRTFSAGPARMDSDISHVSPHTIGTVQVVKGPYALSWGSGTLSAIRVDTFRPEFGGDELQTHGRAGLSFVENGERSDGHASVWGANETVRFSAFHSTRVGNDYEDGNGNTIPGDYESYDTRWTLGFRPSNEHTVDYTGAYQNQQDIDYPGRILDASYFRTQSHAFDWNWTRPAGRWSGLYGQIYVNNKEHRMNNEEKPTALPNPNRIPPFGLRVDIPTSSDTLGGRAYSKWTISNWHWQLGFDFYRSAQDATRFVFRRSNDRLLFEDTVWPDATIQNQGLYTQGVYHKDRAQIGATVRIDAIQAKAGETSSFFNDNTLGETDQNETNVSAALSATFAANDRLSFIAGFGRAVRTASVMERYSDRFPSTKFQVAAEFLGDPSLDPEESLETSVGIIGTVPTGRLTADIFYRDVSNYITVAPDPSLNKRLPLSPNTVFRYVNGDARFWGMELSSHNDWNERVQTRVSLNYVWGNDTSLDEPVFGIPPLELNVAVRTFFSDDRDKWLELSATHMTEQDRVATTRLEVPTESWTSVSLRGRALLGAGFALSGGIENTADEFYATHLNAVNPFTRERIPERGRAVYLGLDYAF